MSAEPAIVHRFAVGPWQCEITAPQLRAGRVHHVTAEWTPSVPDRPLTAAETLQYQQGLAHAMQRAQAP